MGGLARTGAWAFIVLLAGCASKRPVESTTPVELAAATLTTEQEGGALIVTPDGDFLDRNPTYKTFAARVLTTSPTGGQSSVEAARLSSLALDQTLFPQFRPSLSVNEEGDAVGRVGVSQIVFSNGQFQAEKGVLRAGEIEAVANYLVAANQQVADGISDYLDIDYFRRLASTAKKLEEKYTVLVDQAERRVAGGVGDETEIATFRLKLLEARSDLQLNRSNQQLATSRVQDLTAGLSMPQTPPRVQSVASKSEPPEVVLLLAQLAAADSQIELERARRRPSLSLEAFTEQNISTGGTDNGASIGVGVSVPLGVKNDLEIRAAEARKSALDADLRTKQQDIDRQTSQLRASIERDKQRMATLRDLVAAAEARLDNFEQQFLSGTVSLEEAVSILETYRRSLDQLTEARNDILKAQVEVARIQGQLVPAQG